LEDEAERRKRKRGHSHGVKKNQTTGEDEGGRYRGTGNCHAKESNAVTPKEKAPPQRNMTNIKKGTNLKKNRETSSSHAHVEFGEEAECRNKGENAGRK